MRREKEDNVDYFKCKKRARKREKCFVSFRFVLMETIDGSLLGRRGLRSGQGTKQDQVTVLSTSSRLSSQAGLILYENPECAKVKKVLEGQSEFTLAFLPQLCQVIMLSKFTKGCSRQQTSWLINSDTYNHMLLK